MLGEVSNVKFYVTSNLRHLTTYNTNQENLDNIAQKEIYTNLVSLSDRFGCKVGFFENSQKNYLDIINHYAEFDHSDDYVIKFFCNDKITEVEKINLNGCIQSFIDKDFMELLTNFCLNNTDILFHLLVAF